MERFRMHIDYLILDTTLQLERSMLKLLTLWYTGTAAGSQQTAYRFIVLTKFTQKSTLWMNRSSAHEL